MMRCLCVAMVCLVISAPAQGQSHPDIVRARQAYDDLDYRNVIPPVRRALGDPRLSEADRIVAYELLGLTYGTLDSAPQAVDAFRRLIFLDPDREPDPIRVSPRITSLYASALGQVLVVRRIRLDSTSFIGGQGFSEVAFELSRPASAVLRVVGKSFDMRVDSVSVVGGAGLLTWSALDPDSVPVTPGVYQLLLEARFGGDQYETRRVVEVAHLPVDTLTHLDSVPGRSFLPEQEQPGRNWRPLGVAALYTAVASGASLALENTTLGAARREIGGVSFVALVTGLIMSLKRPDPIPVPGNIQYNELLRDELARRNREVAEENVRRRRQVRITVIPRAGGGT